MAARARRGSAAHPVDPCADQARWPVAAEQAGDQAPPLAVFLVDHAAHPARVGGVEFVECLAPSHDAPAFDEQCELADGFAGFMPSASRASVTPSPCASGPASASLTWCGRKVGGLVPA